MSDRKTWTPGDVVDVTGPPALLRNYLEQRDVRAYLHKAAAHTPIHRAYDIGSGFGRLTPVLSEAAAEVVGFEREASLVATARTLLPDLRFELVPTLEHLPAESSSAEFILTFTVLQHMTDASARAVIRRNPPRAGAGGPPAGRRGDQPETGGRRCGPCRSRLHPRPAGRWYMDALSRWSSSQSAPGTSSPGYPRQDVGTYMFFRRS